jgi:hypothetical protein
LKKKMYRVQIEVTTQQSGRIHLERESYTKAKECRLFSSAAPAVATVEANIAARERADRSRTQTGGKPTRGGQDMVCDVDGLPVENGASGLVWRVQYHHPLAFSTLAAEWRV